MISCLNTRPAGFFLVSQLLLAEYLVCSNMSAHCGGWLHVQLWMLRPLLSKNLKTGRSRWRFTCKPPSAPLSMQARTRRLTGALCLSRNIPAGTMPRMDQFLLYWSPTSTAVATALSLRVTPLPAAAVLLSSAFRPQARNALKTLLHYSTHVEAHRRKPCAGKCART